MTAKRTKKDRDTEEDSRLDKIFKGAEKVVRGLKMPGFGDWVTVTVIGGMENPHTMRGPQVYGPQDDPHALSPEAEWKPDPEPEWVMCKPFKTAFRAGDVSEIVEEERGVIIIRHSIGSNGRIIVRESWDEIRAILGITPVMGPEIEVELEGADIKGSNE